MNISAFTRHKQLFALLEMGLRWCTQPSMRTRACWQLVSSRPGEPLFFHHIPKTGGTSLIKSIRSMTPLKLEFSENGHLSAGYVGDLVGRGLRPGQFIYGHPLTGAASALRGRAKIVTLLREPSDQAISNYLWVRRRRRAPDYAAARQLGFREFLLARPYFAIFQTASLHVGIEQKPVRRTEEFIDRLPDILAYLDEIAFLGTIGTVGVLLAEIAKVMAWPAVPAFPHRLRSGLAPHLRAEMREQYAELQNHPALASLLAAEHEVYNRALGKIAARSPNDRAVPTGPEPSPTSPADRLCG